MPTPFDTPILRDWFFQDIEPGPLECENVTILGSSPFEATEFGQFLKNRFGLLCSPDDWDDEEPVETLIVGRESWDEEDIAEALDAFQGGPLKVYSQEMLLAFLATHQDPFDDLLLLPNFRMGHPALEYLSSIGFPWPDTSRVEETNGGGSTNLPIQEISPLRLMGYRVGKRGAPPAKRRIILREAYRGTLPFANDHGYMQEWGTPGSEHRLRKLANFIAARCKREKYRNSPSEEAISDWEEDLEWLRETLYTGRYRFSWPSTWRD